MRTVHLLDQIPQLPEWCTREPSSLCFFKLSRRMVSSVPPDARTPLLETAIVFTQPAWERSVKLVSI